MAVFIPKTIGQSLYWSYANLAMAFTPRVGKDATYRQIQQSRYIVRNKLYHGLSRGTLQLGSFLIDEGEKIYAFSCCYCGSQEDLTLDHLIPKFKGGADSADNLVYACGPCNSSKKALDLLEWMAKRGEFPPLVLLRRYLKLTIRYCIDKGLMDIPLEHIDGIRPEPMPLFDNLEKDVRLEGTKGANLRLPFAMALIPHTFPNLDSMVARVLPIDESEQDTSL